MEKAKPAKFFEHSLPGGRTALISSLGDFSILSSEELGQVKAGKLSKELERRLERDGLLISGRNFESIAKRARQRYRHVFEGVSLHIINPTLRCNHTCGYCYANARPINSRKTWLDLDNGTAEKILDFIWQSPAKKIVMEFQGGEPLANFPVIEHIVNEAKKRKGKKVHFRIVSNLTMMDRTIAAFFQRNGIFDVCTSLDGPKEVHDRNRKILGNKPSYEKVVHWINSLKRDFGFRHVGMLPTITRHSLPFAKEIVDEYASHGMQDIIPVMLRKVGRAKDNWDRIGYSAEQYSRFWQETVEYCISLSSRGKMMAEQYSAITVQKILGKGPGHTCFSKPCGAALTQASYQPNGDIYACDESKAEPAFRIGSVDQNYATVFTSPEALNIVSLSSTLGFLCNECKWNPFCRFCPMLAYSSQGNPVPVLANDMDCAVKKHQIPFIFDRLFSKDREILLGWAGLDQKPEF